MERIDTDAEDREDIARLAAGEDDALDALMGRHAGPLFAFLFRWVGNEADARDLAQDTFVRVYRSRGSYRRESRFSTWLLAIAANLARNHRRWHGRHPTTPLESATDDADEPRRPSLVEVLPAAGASPAEALSAMERAAAVRAAVNRLPGNLRMAVVLCEWEERSLAEAAEILGCSAKAVESQLYRARRLLRERLQRWL